MLKKSESEDSGERKSKSEEGRKRRHCKRGFKGQDSNVKGDMREGNDALKGVQSVKSSSETTSQAS